MADYTTAADVGKLPDELEMLLVESDVAREAHTRYTETDSYQGMLKSAYQRLAFFYAPTWADQWPEDLQKRPGKIHITANIIKPAVNIDARLQSLLPRIALLPDGNEDAQRLKAEAAEKLVIRWLELSEWEVWMGALCRVRSLYGKGPLKVFWNKAEKRPDVRVVENPANLRIGYGSSDFSVIDWTLYEYSISPQEARLRFPHISLSEVSASDGRKHLAVSEESDHSDPLNQRVPGGGTNTMSRPVNYLPSDYEQKQLRVWDYWYKNPDGKGGQTVCNAMFLEGSMVTPAGQKNRIAEHNYLPDIPYIIIPEDLQPGNPEGLSAAEDLIDLQIELNRALSHHAQLVADEIDPAWVLTGKNASSIPPGMIPKAGEVMAAGDENDVHALDKGVNIFPVTELINSFWAHYHKISGLSERRGGEVPGAQTSGRAVAIQVEAAANRLDPRRRHLYSGLRELLVFWTIMAERINPKFPVGIDEETGKEKMGGVKDIVGGFRRWKFVAPEITPRDVFENTQNEINKVNSGLSSAKTAMDALGQDSPEAEMQLMRQEYMDAQLNPAKVQSYTALLLQMQQLQQTQMQMQQQLQQLPQGASPQNPQGLPPGGVLGQGQAAANAVQQQQYQAQPTAVGEDQNQPMTTAGGPPPAAGQGPATTTLIRGGKALNQIAFTS